MRLFPHCFLAAFLAVSILTPVRGQETGKARSEILSVPFRGGGVYNMYPESPEAPGTPPKGYKPFYISHFGRHGARYNLGGYETLLRRLDKAHEQGLLTPYGETFRFRYRKMFPSLRDRGGDLSFKGQRQQFGIAHRMSRNYPEVFRRAPHIVAVSSTVQRCVLTMGAFCLQMAREMPGIDIRMDQGNVYMDYMSAQSDFNPAYIASKRVRKDSVRNADYRKNLAVLVEQVDFEPILGRLFTDPAAAAPIFNDDPKGFVSDLYYLVASTQCVDYEEDFHDLFTPEEWYGLWAVDNFQFYAHFGPAPYFGGLQWATAETLLRKILDEARQDLGEGRIGLRCRFGHDIGLMALLSLLRADGFALGPADPAKVADCWQDYNFPMSVNLQWIFFRNREGKILVHLLLNEEELNLPLPAVVSKDGGKYYEWDLLQGYCEERIADAKRLIESVNN
ncbi:MAG: hypothetical protein IKH49_10020 [Bacteroidales bacterium]|nr:hypothetical protein [Bacteroidales bacterium]